MTVDSLEIIASYFYEESEENPFTAIHPERKRWMAERLREIIDDGGYRLEELLACEDSDQVLNILEGWYREEVGNT